MDKRKKITLFIILFLIAVKLFLVRNQPVFGIVTDTFDDRHFINQARSLLAGIWLGSYNQTTLIKGPFFPIWIAFSFLLGIPLIISEQLFYIFACVILIIALQPVLSRVEYTLILLTLLLFNPMTYDTDAFTRVIRDPIYVSLCILVLACSIALFLRRQRPFTKSVPWAISLGFAFSASALTREETIWLIPPLLFIFILFTIGLKGVQPRRLISSLSLWGFLPAIYLLTFVIVSALNYKYYSLFNVTEMGAPEFVSAYSALERVVPAQFMQFIPITRETRLRIYAVSPAFEELKPYLDGPKGDYWSKMTIAGAGLPKGEIAGGWFIWAFREAVAYAGHYSNSKFPADYYRTLTNEVNTACDTGKLKCLSKSASLTPAWNKAYINPVIESFISGITFGISFKGFYPYPSNSELDDTGKGELLFNDLTQTELSNGGLVYQERYNYFKMSILETIGRLYQDAFLWFTILAAVFFLILTVRIRKMYDAWGIIALIALTILSRIGLLSVINATSFPAINTTYLSPAYPLIIVFTSFTLIITFDYLLQRYQYSKRKSMEIEDLQTVGVKDR
jgi:hypothetical protein